MTYNGELPPCPAYLSAGLRNAPADKGGITNGISAEGRLFPPDSF